MHAVHLLTMRACSSNRGHTVLDLLRLVKEKVEAGQRKLDDAKSAQQHAKHDTRAMCRQLILDHERAADVLTSVVALLEPLEAKTSSGAGTASKSRGAGSGSGSGSGGSGFSFNNKSAYQSSGTGSREVLSP